MFKLYALSFCLLAGCTAHTLSGNDVPSVGGDPVCTVASGGEVPGCGGGDCVAPQDPRQNVPYVPVDLAQASHDFSSLPDLSSPPDLGSAPDLTDDDDDDECRCENEEGHGKGLGHCKDRHRENHHGHGNGHCKYDCN